MCILLSSGSSILVVAAFISATVIITQANPPPNQLVNRSLPPVEGESDDDLDHIKESIKYTPLNIRYRNSMIMLYFPYGGWSLFSVCLVTGNRTLLCNSLQRFSEAEYLDTIMVISPDRIDFRPEAFYTEVKVMRVSKIRGSLGNFYKDDLLWKIVVDRELLTSYTNLTSVTMHKPDWSHQVATVGGTNFRCGVHFFSGQKTEVYDKNANIFNLYIDSNECPPAIVGNYVFEESDDGPPRVLGLIHGLSGETTPNLTWQFKFAPFDETYWLHQSME